MMQITTQKAVLDIRSTPAKITIRQPQADFDLKQTLPKFDIDTEQIRVVIDQSQCFSEAGRKSNGELIQEAAQMGMQAALQGIERRSSEGDMLAAIDNPTNPIPEIALNNLFEEKEFNIDSIPKSRPKIDFVGGTVDIKLIEGKIDIVTKPNKAEIDVRLGGVEISLSQHPSITMRYIGENVDLMV